MKTHQTSSGFALMLVLWTLVVLSAIALTLAASVGTEIRASQDSWNDLQAERLAKSGHEMAQYLETRSLGVPTEDLSGLAVEHVVAGLKYQVAFDIGTVELTLEGENGKFDLASATEEDAATFFSTWTGDFNRGREIAASIADWIDTNDEPRSFGAEFPWYSSRGYRPRNAVLGASDPLLVKGITPDDFLPAMIGSESTPAIRQPLSRFISAGLTGRAVNPNYASPVVLRSLTGMTSGILDRILAMRQGSVFVNAEDFRTRMGLAADSPLLMHLTFNRGSTPAILAVARLRDSSRIRKERRVQTYERRRTATVRFVSLIERSVFAE
jgi:Tfp pilus assembly protein PilV